MINIVLVAVIESLQDEQRILVHIRIDFLYRPVENKDLEQQNRVLYQGIVRCLGFLNYIENLAKIWSAEKVSRNALFLKKKACAVWRLCI